MSPALNGSSALQHFEHGNAVKIRNGIRSTSTRDCHIPTEHAYTASLLVTLMIHGHFSLTCFQLQGFKTSFLYTQQCC